jgi:hypothetical protein
LACAALRYDVIACCTSWRMFSFEAPCVAVAWNASSSPLFISLS